jgi:hypothetical protein
MEIPRIHQQAERHFREASEAAEARKRVTWQEIPELKKEQRVHRQAILATVAVAAFSVDRRFEFMRRFRNEFSIERRVQSQIHEKARQAHNLERRLRAATERAQILTGLMRRARGGDMYAPHQADLVTQPKITAYL